MDFTFSFIIFIDFYVPILRGLFIKDWSISESKYSPIEKSPRKLLLTLSFFFISNSLLFIELS